VKLYEMGCDSWAVNAEQGGACSRTLLRAASDTLSCGKLSQEFFWQKINNWKKKLFLPSWWTA